MNFLLYLLKSDWLLLLFRTTETAWDRWCRTQCASSIKVRLQTIQQTGECAINAIISFYLYRSVRLRST